MSSPDTSSTSPTDQELTAPEFTTEVLDRCARLLATNEMQWPQGLSREQESLLTIKVRQLRRARLVRLIAAGIAADIARAAESRK